MRTREDALRSGSVPPIPKTVLPPWTGRLLPAPRVVVDASLCHAEHSNAVLGMEQSESGAGPTAGSSWSSESVVLCVSTAVDAVRPIVAARGDAAQVAVVVAADHANPACS